MGGHHGQRHSNAAGPADADRTRVVLQCRHRFFREGLTSLLAEEPAIDVIATVVTIEELLDSCSELSPHVVLVDLDGTPPDAMVELAADLESRCPGIRPVALCNDSRLARDTRRSGFVTVVTATDGAGGVLRALLSDDVVIDLDAPASTTQNVLTPREIEVLLLIGEGLTTWEISQQLGISRKTVENHKQRIFMKLDVQNQAHAVSVAVLRGLIDVDSERPTPAVPS